MNNKIQVFIVSQQSLFQQGLEHSLSSMDGIEVSGVVAVDEKVLSVIDNLPPDVAIVDLDGKADGGLELARRKPLLP